jgi:hypothetical protein
MAILLPLTLGIHPLHRTAPPRSTCHEASRTGCVTGLMTIRASRPSCNRSIAEWKNRSIWIRKAARHSVQRLRATFSRLRTRQIALNRGKAAVQASLHSDGKWQRDSSGCPFQHCCQKACLTPDPLCLCLRKTLRGVPYEYATLGDQL